MRTVTVSLGSTSNFHNRHFELPFDVIPYLTGGNNARAELHRTCLPLEDTLCAKPTPEIHATRPRRVRKDPNGLEICM